MTLTCEKLALQVPGRTLCRDLSFSVQPGEVWAVLGPNGSGKSTLLHALAGTKPVEQGTIALDGTPFDQMNDVARARNLGLLLQQEDAAFWGTVRDYVLLGRYAHAPRWAGWQRADEIQADAALERVGMSVFAPRRYASLSGGERQRVRIAQLLAQSPRYLFLDEPLQHLDLKHQAQTIVLVSELVAEQSRAVIMVLHDALWPAQCATHALLLDGNGGASAGTARDMLTRERLEALFGCKLLAVGGDTSADAVGFIPAL